MTDELRPGVGAEPRGEEPPLARPGTDTRLISEMDPNDAAQAIRSALGPAHGGAPQVALASPSAGGAGGGAHGAGEEVIKGRLEDVESRLGRLAELEERFARIEEAIEDLRRRLDREV